MAFHYKIVLAALAITALAAGAGVFAGEAPATVADPGWWLALGEGLVGTSENGWCSCL